MTKIKICGITTLDDAIVAAEAGADFLGFILYPKSPRYVEPSVVRSIVAALRESELRKEAENAPGAAQVAQADCVVGGVPSVQGVVHSRLQFVGVFVNEAATTVAAILAQTGLDFAQLHGDEPPEALTALNGRAYKALRPTGFQDALASAERYWPLGPHDGPRLLSMRSMRRHTVAQARRRIGSSQPRWRGIIAVYCWPAG